MKAEIERLPQALEGNGGPPPVNLASNRSVVIQLWIIGAIFPLLLAAIASAFFLDFGLLWLAARQILSGHSAEIYDSAIGPERVFPYPPHAALIFLPFGLLPRMAAMIAWNVACALFFCWAARPNCPKGFPPILAILTPAAIICLTFGQTGLLLGALWLLAFRGKWPAVALMTFKPHLGILSILSIRSWADFAKIIGLVLAIVALTLILFGPQLWLSFIEHTIDHGGRIGSVSRWQFIGVTPTFGFGVWGWLMFAVAGALLLAKNVNVFTAATATFLIAPYGFHYDMPVVSLGFGILAYRHWHQMPIRHRIPVALGFLAPIIAVTGTWWMPPIIGWALWAQSKYDLAGAGEAAEQPDIEKD